MRSTTSKLLLYTAISLISGLLFSLVGTSVASFLEISSMHVSLAFSSIGIFVVPPIIFSKVFNHNFLEFFHLRNLKPIDLIPFAFLLLLSSLPLLNLIVELNKSLQLPEQLSALQLWMETTEQSAINLTNRLLAMESGSDLLITLLVVAVIPAIGEELAFRGVVQQVLLENSQRHHLAIWGAAAIFSFIHFQFFGFFPRLLLGALFGYLFYWSKSLWVPIFAHFFNNATAVLVAYYFRENGIEKEIETIGATRGSAFMSIVSFLLLTAGLWYFHKRTKQLSC